MTQRANEILRQLAGYRGDHIFCADDIAVIDGLLNGISEGTQRREIETREAHLWMAAFMDATGLSGMSATTALAKAPEVRARLNLLADYKRLEAICENRSDVVDGDEGRQDPNEAMSILMEWRHP